MKRKMFFVMCIALIVFFCGVGFAAEPEKDGSEIVAKVENEVITQGDIDKLLGSLDQQTAMMYGSPEGRAALADELINARLFMLKGMDEGIDKSPEYINELEVFKKHALMKVTVDKMLEKITVTDEDVRKFYDDNPDQFTQPEQVHAKHILVSDDVEMDKVLAELKAGKSFEDTARAYSTCPSKENGGDLGTFGRGQMVPEFEEVAFNTEIGKISEPVKTQFGVHVIRVEEKTPESKVAYEEVAEQIRPYLLDQKRREAYQAELNVLKGKYKIEKIAPVSGDSKPEEAPAASGDNKPE